MSRTVGVITRTKNRNVLLRRALESVLNQSHQDWIQVIVNDGGDPAPVDDLMRLFSEKANGRMRVIHHAESVGMMAASNIGIKLVLGYVDHLILHDDDDTWSPEFLRVALSELEQAQKEHHRICGVVTMANSVKEVINGSSAEIISTEEFMPWLNRGLVAFDQMLVESTFAPIQFLYRASALEQTGLYRDDLPVLGDWDFNVRFMRHYDIKIIPRILAFHHHRIDPDTGHSADSADHDVEKYDLYRQMLRNEWLRDDFHHGRAGMGEVANMRTHIGHIMYQLDQINGRFESAETSKLNLNNGLVLFTLWVGTGQPLHYAKQFLKSLAEVGPRGTMDKLKLWYRIKSTMTV